MRRTRRVLKKIICPGCGQVGSLKKILYGMPNEDFNQSKFLIGGCIVDIFDVGCSLCEWVGVRKDLDGQHSKSSMSDVSEY